MSRFTTRRALAGSILAAAALVGTAGVAHAAFGFDDVNENDTHAAGIQWLVDNGITTGCDADSFCPGEPVTRAQMATFMHRLSGNSNVLPSVDAKTLDGLTGSDYVQRPELITQTMALTNDTVENITASCTGAEYAISGGYEVKISQNGAISDEWVVAASRPTTDNSGWVVSVRTIDGAPHNGYVTVWANCTL
ncbi:MAG: S-layer homology domain-containing protein [Acidimicrobiales bacterium]